MAIYIPNDHRIYQRFQLQSSSKFSYFGIFGLKMYHLATLDKIMDKIEIKAMVKNSMRRKFRTQLLDLVARKAV
jgi:hypothetical protein